MGALRVILVVFVAALAPVLTGAGTAVAQDLGQVVSPILTLDRDQLFTGTAYGQRVNAELEAASAAMAAETREIEAALEEEEKALTEQRATLDTAAFRALADAFDEKVQALRAEREQAQTNLRGRIEQAQLDFFNRIGPILGAIVRARGAVLIVDRRAILLAAADVDITDEAIARIDAVLGDGVETPDDEAASDTTPAGEGPLDTIPAPADDGAATGTDQ